MKSEKKDIESVMFALVAFTNDFESKKNIQDSKVLTKALSDLITASGGDLFYIYNSSSNILNNLSRTFIQKAKPLEVLDNEKFKLSNETDIANMSAFLSSAKTDLQKEIDTIEQNITSNEAWIGEIYEVKNNKSNVNTLAIQFGIPAFCLTILLLHLVPYLYLRKHSSGVSPASKLNKEGKSLLDVSTVLLLTMTILILGLSKMITGEVLGTLLGGISGYVLNRNLKAG